MHCALHMLTLACLCAFPEWQSCSATWPWCMIKDSLLLCPNIHWLFLLSRTTWVNIPWGLCCMVFNVAFPLENKCSSTEGHHFFANVNVCPFMLCRAGPHHQHVLIFCCVNSAMFSLFAKSSEWKSCQVRTSVCNFLVVNLRTMTRLFSSEVLVCV